MGVVRGVVVSGRVAVLFSVFLAVGCYSEVWTNADVQLDITDAPWLSTDRARVCIEGVGIVERALRSGHVAVAGLAPDEAVTVTVDLFDGSSDLEPEASGAEALGIRMGRAGPIVVGSDGLHESIKWEPCDPKQSCSGCSVQETNSDASDNSWLLAVRFL